MPSGVRGWGRVARRVNVFQLLYDLLLRQCKSIYSFFLFRARPCMSARLPAPTAHGSQFKLSARFCCPRDRVDGLEAGTTEGLREKERKKRGQKEWPPQQHPLQLPQKDSSAR